MVMEITDSYRNAATFATQNRTIMKTANAIIFGALILFTSCSQTNNTETDTTDPTGIEEAGTWYGEEFEVAEPMTLADLTTKSATGTLTDVQVKAQINGVCKKKGCWMTLADGENEMRVTFYDYGFFVPLDCENMVATLKGKASLDTISVADLQHYAEDAGQSEDEIAAITEPEYELVFEATGAYLE